MLTEEQIQQLLATSTVEDFRRLLADFGFESPADIMSQDQRDVVTPHLVDLEAIEANVDQDRRRNERELAERAQAEQAALSEIDAAVERGEISQADADRQRRSFTSDARLMWVYETPGVLQPGQADLTEEQKQRLLTEFRIQQGINVGSFDELVATGVFNMGPVDPYGNPTTAAQIVNDVLLEVEPAPAHLVRLNGGRQFAVEDLYLQRAAALWNVTPTSLNRIVRLADRAGMVGGPNNSQVFWQPLVMLMRMGGVWDEWAQTAAPADSSQRRGHGPNRDVSDGEDVLYGSDILSSTIRRQSTDATQFTGTGRERLQQRRQLEGMGETIVAPDYQLSLTELTTEFREGRELYNGDAGLALIHVMDPQLANRVAREVRATGNASGLSTTDRDKVLDLIATMGAGVNPGSLRETLVGTGYLRAWGSPDDAFATFIEQEASRLEQIGGAGGGSGRQAQEPTVVLPDPAALNETFRNLYREMFLADPTEEQLANFRSQINSATQSAQTAEPGSTVTNVSPEARAMEILRDDPRYQELYGNKPEGMSETDYRSQFEAAQRDMLGNESAGNVALLAGLRSGRYQTAVGAAAATPEAWQNSRFLGRLFQAGRVVGAAT